MMIPFPNKKYQIIYADPPWRYDFCPAKSSMIENHYQTMPTEDICKLEIPSDKDCVLFLWATCPKLIDAIQVMDSWGFTYKTNAVWDKKRKGMGYWFLGQHELLLVGTKGKFPPPSPENRISSVWEEIRTEHSHKPVGIRTLIKNWYPDCLRIELFARKEEMLFDAYDFDGWDVWGNEV